MLKNAVLPITSLGSLVRHPIFLIAVIGIAIRLAISPFLEVGYDSDFWATIVRNLRSGEGLYGLEGYYYTPVWGYFLSFFSVLQDVFLNIGVMGLRVPEALYVETLDGWLFSATVTSVAFNVWVKMPFVISDLIVGYLIYWLIKDKTGDMRKATIGFALWFLCPLVILLTSISGMFDTFSVLFTLLCIIMVRKDKLFLAGVLFAFAVLTKFFPIYFVFPLIAYILVTHRGDGKAARSLLAAAAGAFLAFLVLMAPQIADGSFIDSFTFLTARADPGANATLFNMIESRGATVVFLAGIIVSLVLGYLLNKKSKEELDDSFFKYLLIMASFLFLYPPLPQYLSIVIPFLAIFIVTKDSKLKWSWLIISVGGAALILGGSFVLLLSLGTFTDLMSLEFIMSMIEQVHTPVLFGMTPTLLLYNIPGIVQYIGVLTIFWLLYRGKHIGAGAPAIPFRLRRSSSCKRPRE